MKYPLHDVISKIEAEQGRLHKLAESFRVFPTCVGVNRT